MAELTPAEALVEAAEGILEVQASLRALVALRNDALWRIHREDGVSKRAVARTARTVLATAGMTPEQVAGLGVADGNVHQILRPAQSPACSQTRT